MGCEKEIYENSLQEKENVSRVNLNDLPFLKKSLNKKFAKGSFAKEELIFYLDKINTENIIQIIDQQGLKNYTFAINYRTQDTIYNLCAKEKNEGNYTYSLVKYSSQNIDQWIEDLKSTNQSSINPDIKADLLLDSRTVSLPCISVLLTCPSGEHNSINSYGCIYNINQWSMAVTISLDCFGSGGGGVPSVGNTVNNSGGDITNPPIGTSGSDGGGGGGGGPVTPNPDPLDINHDGPVITIPNVEIDINPTNINYLANLNLTINQNAWLNTNLAVKTNILSYLINHHTPDDYAFAQQFVEQSYLNTNLSLDFNASLKSPVNIDLTKVTATDPNDPQYEKKKKFMCIYDKLLKSPKFRQLFVATFQESIRPNVLFELANLSGNANSGLVGQTIPTSSDGYNNTILIDTDLLTSGNNMLIANTILHECIHAFLNVKLTNPSIGISIPNINNMDVQDCINEYYTGFNNNQNQHDFIYNNLIPTIAMILSEIKDLLVDSQTNSQMQLLQINNSIGSTPWNWNDFYNIQAMDGLERCQFFISEIATIGINGLPTATVDFNKWFKYNEYKSKSRQNLNNNCTD